jgi:hypothetical protein
MWLPCRDCILVRHWRTLPDGTVVHGDFTLDDYAGVPAKDTLGRVRAKETFGGTVLKQKGPNRCFVMIVNDMDPRIPGVTAGIQAQVNDYTASMLSQNLKKLVDLVKTKNLESYMEAPPMCNLTADGASVQVDDSGNEPEDTAKWPRSTATVVLALGVISAVAFQYAF